MRALGHKLGHQILWYLLQQEKPVSFTHIQDALKVNDSATLSCDSNFLQQAWLIERHAEFGNPRNAQDPYYCFYNLTPLGAMIAKKLIAVNEEIAQILKSAGLAPATSSQTPTRQGWCSIFRQGLIEFTKLVEASATGFQSGEKQPLQKDLGYPQTEQ